MLDISQQILNQTYTRALALKRVELLRIVVNQRLFSKAIKETPTDLSEEDQAWINSLGEGLFKQFNKDTAIKLISTIEDEINTIQPLTLFVPVELPKREIEAIGQQLRQAYGPTFLFEVKLNPLLIAGAALVWKGIYKDYSLHQKIADNHSAILAKFKEYIKAHG